MQIFLPSSERFHYFDPPSDPGICWTMVVALVLNFAVVIGVGVALWRLL